MSVVDIAAEAPSISCPESSTHRRVATHGAIAVGVGARSTSLASTDADMLLGIVAFWKKASLRKESEAINKNPSCLSVNEGSGVSLLKKFGSRFFILILAGWMLCSRLALLQLLCHL